MPVHDWSKVKAGAYRDFHVEWMRAIKHALNHGILPQGYYSMVEQVAAGFEADFLTLELTNDSEPATRKRKSLTAVRYEAAPGVRAYVEHFALGQALPEMPLFLEPGGCVEVPLETTYQEAFAEVPRRSQTILAR